ncbi:hypothetical protein [Burkholderia ubonensis]|uniref:hypothetical protein n=1 Tax=Burkholderia ubonensis TaxID=101571 RepID=UPI0012F86D9E|nr:hypothetical protein [Burkholderia ubonensis]
MDKLDAAMATHKAKKDEEARVQELERQERDRFEKEAGLFLQTVVYQELEIVGNHLRQGGHDFRIETDLDKLSITLHVYVDSTYADHHYVRDHMSHPSVSLLADTHGRQLRFHAVRKYRGGGGQSGSEGRPYNLDELNALIIRDVVVDVISDSLTK